MPLRFADAVLALSMPSVRCRLSSLRTHVKVIAEKARYLKDSKEGVSEMCREMEKLRNESYAEGLEQGLEQGMREHARSMAIKLRLSGEPLERIADLVGYSAATVEKWLSPVG